MLTKRGKARLILIFSTITNCKSMAYRSFKSENCSARGVRKVTTGMTIFRNKDHPVGFRLPNGARWLGNSHPRESHPILKGTTGMMAFGIPRSYRAVLFEYIDVGSSYHWSAAVHTRHMQKMEPKGLPETLLLLTIALIAKTHFAAKPTPGHWRRQSRIYRSL